ncbi:type 4 pilus major pilin [Cupriavidus sp. TMH.W2]|uniref:type 4 pilus major pilin n=1 Tax=Cupriavidus sp. TMH.W2 TaxID=3434465 RepID=UPI003D77CE5E
MAFATFDKTRRAGGADVTRIGRKRQQGFTMMELGLVLIVAVVLVFAAVRMYNGSRADSKAQSEVGDITRVLAKTQDSYSALPDYTGVTTAVLINNNVFPTGWVNAARTAVVNNFNGAVTAAPFTLVNANDAVAVTSASYDRASCSSLPMKVSNAVRRLDINGTTVMPLGGAVDPALVGTSCLANGNTFIYYVGK